jgi:DNA-binding protein H-NS
MEEFGKSAVITDEYKAAQAQKNSDARALLDKHPSKLKGRKCEPKYRGPNGETWSGRGKLPKFIRDSGQDKEAFRI